MTTTNITNLPTTNPGNHNPSPDEVAAAQADALPATEVNDFNNCMKGQCAYDQWLSTQILHISEEEGLRLADVPLAVMEQRVEILLKLAQAHQCMMAGTAQRRISLQERPVPQVHIPPSYSRKR